MGGIDTTIFGNTTSLGPRRFNAFTTPFRVTETYYKFRGWYSAGNVYETWITTRSDRIPPSGHSLSDIVLIDTWNVEGRTY